MTAIERCPLCTRGMLSPLRDVDGVQYLRCDTCGSILAEAAFLDRTMAGEARNYDDNYWASELKAAQERGYGASLVRLAEVFLYARRPVRRFLDISSGAGTLLDAAAEILPEIADVFWGVEPFPPPVAFRARHPNYRIGHLHTLDGKFDGGTCIEVIEHLPPSVLRAMLTDLASISEPDAVWYFNSAQPTFVIRDDPSYLDPYTRGHIASYSIEGLRPVFAEVGFTLNALPGRDWAFLAEYTRGQPEDSNAMLERVWRMLPENRALLGSARFGPLLLVAALEGARCYIEAAAASWAVGELRRHEAMRAELLSTTSEMHRAINELVAIRASTSWRITKPLRGVAQIARRFFGPT